MLYIYYNIIKLKKLKYASKRLVVLLVSVADLHDLVQVRVARLRVQTRANAQREHAADEVGCKHSELVNERVRVKLRKLVAEVAD